MPAPPPSLSITTGTQGTNDPRMLALLERIEAAIAGQSGEIHIQVVTPDGRQLKTEIIRATRTDMGRQIRAGAVYQIQAGAPA